ncbi:hybrid sensor histidine kinase/response regulator [Solimonas marina]|uniref:Chemotaxis protein CheA n=1 Tax=Solimonas marina TaxID=2714601 RepID=A0A969W8H1_9GAMM|nr:Hpt domain-containing protein [Solimonas marina]NKF22347.1 response regulator [Solimonas marina]
MNARIKEGTTGLLWVRGELDQSVTRARSLIEQYLDDQGDPLPLQQAYVELHQVRGTAAMIRCHGAAMLAGEMTGGLDDLLQKRAREGEVLFTALLGGTVQLIDYVQALSEEMPDCALVLQPAINELRLARGLSVLTESDVFVAQLQSLGMMLPELDAPVAAEVAQEQARRYLAAFQASLLSWIRNAPDARIAETRIGKIAEQLAQQSSRVETYQLWRTAAAAIEALLGRTLDDSLELKRLFGRVGQQMKQIAEQGEDAVATASLELSLQLLFMVGRSRGRGARVQALRQAFALDACLPDPVELEDRRRRIHGPSTSLLAQVSDEIRRDFVRVKDHVDLVVRAGGQSEDGFAESRQSLQRIADVLGALGLRTLQQTVTNQAKSLESLGADAGLSEWITFAESILRVENSLEDALFRQFQPVAGKSELAEGRPTARDYSDGVDALYRESLVNLARVKQGIDGFMKSGLGSELPAASALVGEVASGFRILGLEALSASAERLQHFIGGASFAAVRGNTALAERLADAIATLEYYIEAARDQSPLVDVLPSQLAASLDAIDRLLAPPPAEPAVVEAPVADAETEADSAPTVVDVDNRVAGLETAAEPAAIPPMPIELSSPAGDDDEIREIFLEEAGEVLGTLRDQLPYWTRDPRDRERLTTIRRSFHTLKGSGRTVGASALGEFAWAIESLLNRCLDGSVPPNGGIVTVVNDAIALLPALIEEFRERRSGDGSAEALAARAQAWAEGRDPDAAAEPDMPSIFREDAREKLAYVREWLAGLDEQLSMHAVDADVVRAFHTLRGSARIVDAPAISELATALEHWLDRLAGGEGRLDDAGLSLIEAATDTLGGWCEQVGSEAAAQQDARLWIEQIESLQGSVDRLHEDDEARQLADIFAGEALDLVQKAEGLFGSWQQSPDEQTVPQQLKVVFHTLTGAALMADCKAIGAVARALQLRMDEAAAARIRPSPAAFSELDDICELMYQQLDAYRDGKLNDDGAALVARVEALQWDAADVAAVEGAMPEISSEVSRVADVVESLHFAPPLREVEPEATADPAQTTFDVGEPEAAEAQPEAPTGLAIDPAYAGVEETIEMLPVAEPQDAFGGGQPDVISQQTVIEQGLDPELLHIFVGEAEELLDSYDGYRAILDEHPHDGDALAALRRVLHTLKGSARVAGVLSIGSVAHELEAISEHSAHWTPVLTERFAATSDSLRGAIDELRRGRLPVLDAVIAALRGETPPEVTADDPDAGEAFAFFHEHDPHHAPAAPQPGFVEPDLAALPTRELIELASSYQPDTAAADDAGMTPPVAAETPAEHAFPFFHEHEPAPHDQASADTTTADTTTAEPPSLDGLEVVDDPAIETPPAVDDVGSVMPAPVADDAVGVDDLSRPADVDTDLMQIFSAEALELLEQLEQAYARWRVAPAQAGPAQDMQRALHTLKGGARVAGLFAMGDAAHELETRLVALEASGVVDAEVLSPVGDGVAGLRAMSDRVERGDFSGLLRSERATIEAPRAAPVPSGTWEPELFWRPDEDSEREVVLKRETARVPVESLDRMLNDAGEIAIYRSRLEEHNSGIATQLSEMAQAVTRVREQLRQLDIETDAQIAARGLTQSDAADRYAGEFDPLEMDRYTRMQELSRALAESVGDLAALHTSMDGYAAGAEVLLQQQGRVNTEVQQGLMRTLMVPFSRQAARLQRVVQQTAIEGGKRAEIVFSGADAELDRNVLERMTAPLEHLLRNAVVHGIEAPQARMTQGKPALGQIRINLWREGTQLHVEVSDDGGGLDFDAIRATAVRRGLMPADAQIPDEQAAQFIFMPGFSTARELTQDAGRGVGMDVVAAEVKQLGGTLELSSKRGEGARFLVRLPLNLALSQALLVEVGSEPYAVPLSSIEGIVRITRDALPGYYAEDGPLFAYGDAEYRVRSLAGFIGSAPAAVEGRSAHAILVRLPEGIGTGERRYAVVVDALIGNREIVSKAVGPQISSVPGVTGATILADGRAVLILDLAELAQDAARRALRSAAAGAELVAAVPTTHGLIMVVDDSLTIRRVTERLLVRQGYSVITAKDGLDAMAQLQTEAPDAILLDIEMPRADGFEVATHVRNTARIARTPIIMITSRSGEKHRERAQAIGVDRYLIKPYQDEQLLGELRGVLKRS